MRVILEVGKKRRVVAGAMDWPGLDRWGPSEENALEKLSSYVQRYAGVAARAGRAEEYASSHELDVVERVPGSSSTDFWGIAHVPSEIEREVLPAAELERLWAREMPTGVYDARLLSCQTPRGPVTALAFTLSRRSEACTGRLPDEQMVHILRHASGRYGTTLEYLAETAHALRRQGLHDREIERLMGLAAHHGLI